ncbi:EAL domain-containing protein [Vibrio sp. TH_r3]|uniref:bifunctional diguanylate cyclase/phosphodiesterase n=1 Tax=Vibrio sp. TH_r3 TaxID=3082084 RepID=UPI0029530CA6|nr:EAL domain-containing protein [Vibrio sp. TH_r3]MDV7104855.1 EAL domain-containing protein [Vibrio sp. TH_r3]
MTLHKQLVAGMLAVFLLLVSSVFAIEFSTTRNFLIQQQRSEVNNTINTVGLALAPYLEQKDKVAVESVINALFDGSSYSVVKLTFLDDNEEILRTYPVTATDVPNWFINMNLLSKLEDKRVVTSGWLQLAEIEIVSHPGEAYVQLWAALKHLGIVFIFSFTFGMLLISAMLKRSLRPLFLITKKMQDIAENKFGEPLKQPKTKDLVPVVNGINLMSKQVEQSFKTQAQEAEKLRERAYMDPVSQLGNRSFFMGQLNQWLQESSRGGVALLRAKFIKDAYDEFGYEAGDTLIRELADHLKLTTNSSISILARINTEEFAFIFPNIEKEDLETVANDIVANIQSMRPDPTGTAPIDMALGLVFSETQKSSTEILSLVDNALSQAIVHPEQSYDIVSEDNKQSLLGKLQWKELVEEAINSRSVEFKFQSATNHNGTTFHKEVFSSIEKDGVRYTANQYLFALDQLNAGYLFDQFVIEDMIQKLNAGAIQDTLAINLTVSSISEPSFIRWLTKLLAKHPKAAPKLHFEIPEICFISHQHHTALLCHAIRSRGSDFGVDNYGRHFHSLDYINEFRPNYVKLDYLYTHQIEDEKQAYTLTSISRAAHNLGIKTIASRVETKAQLDFLSKHYIEAFQGFIVDK